MNDQNDTNNSLFETLLEANGALKEQLADILSKYFNELNELRNLHERLSTANQTIYELQIALQKMQLKLNEKIKEIDEIKKLNR